MKWLSVLSLVLTFSVFGQSDTMIARFRNRDTIRYRENLQAFFSKWEKGSDVKVIQLGDSHVQMGHFPQAVQATLSASGDTVEMSSFWFPYALTGGYNAAGIVVDTVGSWKSTRMVDAATDRNFALTGHSLWLAGASGDETPHLEFKFDKPAADFQFLIETTKKWNFSCAEATVERKQYSTYLSIVTVHFPEAKKRFEIFAYPNVQQPDTLRVYGFRSMPAGNGFEFQSYGSSGGKYADYVEKCAYCFDQLKSEKPDLVILSLGTNDAHKPYSESEFYDYARSMVYGIQEASPKTSILLTTKPDTFFKNMKPISEEVVKNVLERVAGEYKCALWSLSDVMGGDNSILDWYMDGLASADLMHFTPKGYHLQGQLLVEALVAAKKRFME